VGDIKLMLAEECRQQENNSEVTAFMDPSDFTTTTTTAK
jgi:hypothetical protein